MIYDPRRRALELRQRIIESMTADELEQYVVRLEREANQRPDVDAAPVDDDKEQSE